MNEGEQHTISNQHPDEADEYTYWPSVAVAAIIVGVITFIATLIGGYWQISSEPSGSLIQPAQIFMSVVPCLVGAIAGLIAIWHYTKEQTPHLTLGKGAIIGLLTGVLLAVVTLLLNNVWDFIDPNYTANLRDSMIANMEAMQMPEEAKQSAIDSIYNQFQNQDTFVGQMKNLGIGVLMYGILNLLTGLIGVKVFGEEKEL